MNNSNDQASKSQVKDAIVALETRSISEINQNNCKSAQLDVIDSSATNLNETGESEQLIVPCHDGQSEQVRLASSDYKIVLNINTEDGGDLYETKDVTIASALSRESGQLDLASSDIEMLSDPEMVANHDSYIVEYSKKEEVPVSTAQSFDEKMSSFSLFGK